MTNATSPSFPVFIVDDEVETSRTEALALEMAGITSVIICNSAAEARTAFAHTETGLAILDISMPEVNGIALLDELHDTRPGIRAMMLTGLNDLPTAVECMRKGAIDYLVKPVDTTRLVTSVKNAIALLEKEDEARLLGSAVLTSELKNPAAFSAIITANPHMTSIFRYLDALAPTSLPLLISGETGTGKELIAEAVHAASGRTGKLVRVNTAGIDDLLISDTLFGHEKGAFTGADRARTGLIAAAAGGTLFLDEIGDLKPESQVKLLRLLQDGSYYPLGSERELLSQARIVTATNRTPAELQQDKTFRRDLFYRLKSHTVLLPPLRERMDDIPMLADHFLEEAAFEQGKKCPVVPRELYTLLSNYHYPGNVRELRGMLFDAVGRHTGGVLNCDSIRHAVGLDDRLHGSSAEQPAPEIIFPSPLPTLAQTEESLVREALRRSNGNKSIAASLIGITRQTLRLKTGTDNPDR
jgi:DNA-binding NtrC family response regulator